MIRQEIFNLRIRLQQLDEMRGNVMYQIQQYGQHPQLLQALEQINMEEAAIRQRLAYLEQYA